MHLLSPDEFKQNKKSDTIVIYGSGWSINEITDSEKDTLTKYDSIGFNWFLRSNIATTFYVIREQANNHKRVSVDETPDIFISQINREPYIKSILVVHDITEHSPKSISYNTEPYLSRFNGSGVIVKDIHSSGQKQRFNKDIFTKGVYHGSCTLNNIIHIAIYLGYSRMIFAGIDLNDSRYFWLKYDETRHTVAKKKQQYNSRHAISVPVLNIISQIKDEYNIDMSVVNPRSLLTKLVKVWNRK